MKFCQSCGNEVHEDAVVCVKCGVAIKGAREEEMVWSGENIVFCVLSFLIPIVGLVLYLKYKDEKPALAKFIGICGIAGIALYGILTFIF